MVCVIGKWQRWRMSRNSLLGKVQTKPEAMTWFRAISLQCLMLSWIVENAVHLLVVSKCLQVSGFQMTDFFFFFFIWKPSHCKMRNWECILWSLYKIVPTLLSPFLQSLTLYIALCNFAGAEASWSPLAVSSWCILILPQSPATMLCAHCPQSSHGVQAFSQISPKPADKEYLMCSSTFYWTVGEANDI